MFDAPAVYGIYLVFQVKKDSKEEKGKPVKAKVTMEDDGRSSGIVRLSSFHDLTNWKEAHK